MRGGRQFDMADHSSEYRSLQSHPPEADAGVFLVDLNGLANELSDLMVEAGVRSGKDTLTRETISKAAKCSKFRRAFRELLAARGRLVANPRSAPQYGGLAADGNPIVFFFHHFRLQVEAGGYYQTDLARDSARLFNAMRNLLSRWDRREKLEDADAQIRQSGFEPVILGARIRDVEDLSRLVPARKGLEARRPARPPHAVRANIAAE